MTYERQRVWRACQACRRKKVKCDGEHPCQSCTRNRSECVFEPYSNMRLMDPQYVKGLESRISQMENELKRHQSSGSTRVGDNLQMSADHSYLDTPSHHQDGSRAHPILEGAVSEPTDRDRVPLASTAIPTQGPSPEMMSQINEHNNDDPVEMLLLDEDESFNQHNGMTPSELTAIDITHLDEPILDVLIDLFYRSIYQIFPIVHPRTFRIQYDSWIAARRANDRQAEDNDFSCLLYSLLAVAASMLPKDHIIFEQKDLEVYRRIDLAALLYSHASLLSGTRPCFRKSRFPTNVVISQGLMSVYLTEIGEVNDAWVTAGHAIRLYQSLDLDEHDDSLTEENSRSEHKQLWWCLYILDRSLSTALLKPLAIDDADSDMESCSGEEDLSPTPHSRTDPWFSVIADFHVTMGKIYRSVRWIRKSQPCKTAQSRDKLRSHVKKHDAELERYYKTQVLPRIEEPNTQIGPLALQTIAISSYYIGVVLLYRTFIERHNISEPDIFLRCAEAASSCIKVTPQVMATVPASHFVIQQSRAIYASTKVLLHCMRLAQNPSFTNKAWPDVESGFNTLRDIKIQWPEIRKYQTMTEEDMKFTQSELNKHAMFYQAFSGFGQTAHSPALDGSPILQIKPARNHCLLGSSERRESQRNNFRNSISRSVTESSQGHDGGDELQRNPKRRKLTPESFFPCDPTAIMDMLPNMEDTQDCETTDLPLDGFSGLYGPFLDDEFAADAFDDSLLLNSIEQFMSYPSD